MLLLGCLRSTPAVLLKYLAAWCRLDQATQAMPLLGGLDASCPTRTDCLLGLQTAGVVDSGVDMDSCYVWDPSHTDYQSATWAGQAFSLGSGVGAFYNNTHRKVRRWGMLHGRSE
jgi:hypothetical protein